MGRFKKLLTIILVLVVFAPVASAYVPPAEKILERWQETYDNAPELEISGRWVQGANVVPFTVRVEEDGVKISEPSLPVTDGTSKLVWTLLLRPRKIIPTLTARGLDLEKTGLARYQGRIALTVGAEGENKPGTQVWLDRETKRPLKLVLELENGRGLVSFEGYDESPSKLYPSSIRTVREGSVRTYEIETLRRAPAPKKK